MDWLISLSVGGSIVLLGTWYLIRHYKTIARFENDAELSGKQRTNLVNQHKRRRITTCLVIAVGILIPLVDYATSTLKNPLFASIILLTMLILVSVIILSAIGDILSSRIAREDLDIKKAETELKRRDMEQKIAQHFASRDNPTLISGTSNVSNHRNGYQK